MQLIQNINGKTIIHGIANTVSELVSFYYLYRQQFGYMMIIDTDNNILATLGSEK